MNFESTVSEKSFADVTLNAWYAPYIASLCERSVINGIEENKFGVGMNVTREDFAVMIYRALNLTEVGDNNFTDKESISPYAVSAVNALYEKRIVAGFEDGSFKPKANITRAEGAKIIYNVLLSE